MNAPYRLQWSQMDGNQKVEAVARLLDIGATYSAIAETLGAPSRNAVAGVATRGRRMGIIPPAEPRSPRSQDEKNRRRRERKASRKSVGAVSPRVVSSSTGHDADESPAPIPEPRTLTLMELTDTTCRFPLGDPYETDFRFCGADAPMDEPYCAHHRAICWQGGEP